MAYTGIVIRRILATPETGIILVMLSLVVLFQSINPVFLSPLNIAGMLRAMAYPGIIAVGMALCLINGTIDLSIGATAGLASVVFAEFSGLGLITAAIITITAGIVVGIINGVLITRLRVTAFIATLCMMYAVRGLASWISNGYNIYPLPDGFAEVGTASPLGISWAFIVMVSVMVLFAVLLCRTVWGLQVRAIGSDEESARCTEVDVNQIRLSVFIIAGGLAALAGVMLSLIINSGNATVGTGWELIAVAACAIGGVSLFGYDGSMGGLFVGLLVLQIIQNGIVVVGISPYTQQIVIGAILLTAMVVEVKRRKWLNMESI
jgi:ribose transport system permease protein